jgi:hypothetical protein
MVYAGNDALIVGSSHEEQRNEERIYIHATCLKVNGYVEQPWLAFFGGVGFGQEGGQGFKLSW